MAKRGDLLFSHSLEPAQNAAVWAFCFRHLFRSPMRICLLFAIHSFEWFLSKRSFISNSKRLLVLSFWSRFVGEPITDNHSCNLHLGTDDQEPGREASERRTALVPKKWSPYFCFSLFPRTALEKMESVPIFR